VKKVNAVGGHTPTWMARAWWSAIGWRQGDRRPRVWFIWLMQLMVYLSRTPAPGAATPMYDEDDVRPEPERAATNHGNMPDNDVREALWIPKSEGQLGGYVAMARYQPIDPKAVMDDRVAETATNGHRSKLHPAPEASASEPEARRVPLARAGLQVLLGYAWLVAGVDKLLLATFPAMLAPLLSSTLPMVPAPFSGVLQAIVLPHSALFGVLVELGEQLTGLGLIAAGLAGIFARPLERRLAPPAARWVDIVRRLIEWLAPIAALGGLVMGLSFYLVDGAPWQGFMPSTAFGGALDEGFLLAMGSGVLLAEWAALRLRRRSRAAQPGLPAVRAAANGHHYPHPEAREAPMRQEVRHVQ
jgi:hypothetical protein